MTRRTEGRARRTIDLTSEPTSLFETALEEGRKYLAQHDTPTGLANLAYLEEQIQRGLLRSRQTQQSMVVILVDLDRFRRIQDLYGSDAGVVALCAVADRLRRFLRFVDCLGQIGEDEFAVVLEDVRDPEEALGLARQISDAIKKPVDLEGEEVVLTASIGVHICRDESDPRQVLRRADLAMHEARSKGCGLMRWTPFIPKRPSYVGLPTRPLFGEDLEEGHRLGDG